MSNPTTSPTRAELLAKIEAGRASIAALRDEAREFGRMSFKVRDMHVHLLHRLLDALAAAPSSGAALPVLGSDLLCEHCARQFCPFRSPLHFDKDGCPACDAEPTCRVCGLAFSAHASVISHDFTHPEQQRRAAQGEPRTFTMAGERADLPPTDERTVSTRGSNEPAPAQGEPQTCATCGETVRPGGWCRCGSLNPSSMQPSPQGQARRDSHRVSSDCGPECQPCEDAKYLARQLTKAQGQAALVREKADREGFEREIRAAYIAGQANSHRDAEHYVADRSVARDRFIDSLLDALGAVPQPRVDVEALKVQSYVVHEADPLSVDASIFLERAPQRQGPDKWAVRMRGRCLNHDGEWEWEPQPSSRDDAFLARCRFDTPSAALARLPDAPEAQPTRAQVEAWADKTVEAMSEIVLGWEFGADDVEAWNDAAEVLVNAVLALYPQAPSVSEAP